MRIIAGQFRGQVLASVGKGDVKAHLRPTSDRVRESLFSILAGGRFGDPIDGVHVLDLFAGTGALGLEAVSRGALSVVFVDNGRVAQKLLQDNMNKCRLDTAARVIKRDAHKLPVRPVDQPACGLVFLDPPYGKSLGEKALSAAQRGGWLASNALIVWEESVEVTAPEGFELLDIRRFGDTKIHFLRLRSGSE